MVRQVFHQPLGFSASRPDLPVLPFGARTAVATFIDPSVRITNGRHVVVGGKTFIAPYATLNARSGFIKIGSSSAVLDNASITSGAHSAVEIGDNVLIAPGATITGASVIGAYGKGATATSVGPNAVINGATIEPGAMVGPLAKVGPGVTVLPGTYVLPGADVTTEAEATNPALGKVRAVTSADITGLATYLSNEVALAAGYTTLYQGQAATGVSPGVASPSATTGPFNGNLSNVLGSGPEAGSPAVSFEPAGLNSPRFLASYGALVPSNLNQFKARVTGNVYFNAPPTQVEQGLGRSNSIRGDSGQPITFDSPPTTGTAVTITAPLGGSLPVGTNLQVGGNAVILGGPSSSTVPASAIGNNVTIGPGAVVDRSTIGTGASIGAGAYVSQSTIPVGATVPAGEILIANVVKGFVQP